MGGTDSESNLIELSIEEHAEAHRLLWEQHGKIEDKLAWQGLLGLIDKEELMKTLLSEAGKRGAIKGNANRKGIKYQKHKDGGNWKPVGTGGTKWYYNPNDLYERGCFREGSQPNGWVRGQGKKRVNPGLNFHAKRNKSC